MGCKQSNFRSYSVSQPEEICGNHNHNHNNNNVNNNNNSVVGGSTTSNNIDKNSLSEPHIHKERDKGEKHNNNNNGEGRPSVPADCWYSREFTEPTRMSPTEFHMKHRGAVVFSGGYVPVGAAELDRLPARSPPTAAELMLGRDLVYGMAYLHNTPLFTEHQWRRRVAHYVKLLQSARGRPEEEEKENGDTMMLSEKQMQRVEEMAASVYERPGIDTLVGIRVFVDDVLVPDHYPTRRSTPNCTATIDTSEAFNNWICVPIVLVGYLNNFMLSTITLYRYLSLNFAEYMLRQPIQDNNNNDNNNNNNNTTLSGAMEINHKASKEEGEKKDKSHGEEARRVFNVRIEVVYGCRSEVNFCTEYIAKGSVQIVMTKQSKVTLKSYEEKLRKIIQGGLHSREQVVPMDRLDVMNQKHTSRKCLFCGSPLKYTCTICGAQLCGTVMCVWRPFAGYPSGCSVHKAQA